MKRKKVIGIIISISLILGFSIMYINKISEKDLDKEESKLTAVMVEQLNKESYEEGIKYPGKLTYGKQENLASMVDEKIVYVGFKEGDYVKKGDVILRFDSSEIDKNLAKAKEDYEKALTKSNNDGKGMSKEKEKIEKEIKEKEESLKEINIKIQELEKSLEALEERLKNNEITEEEYSKEKENLELQLVMRKGEEKKVSGEIKIQVLALEALKGASESMGKLNFSKIEVESTKKMYEQMEKMKENYIIKAPISGKITALNGYLNEKVENKLMPLATISNSDTLSFELGVDEDDKEKFLIGEEVHLEVEKDGKKIKEVGKIISIDKKPDVRTAQHKIKVEINNKNNYKIDSYAEAFIDKKKSIKENVLSKNALLRENEKNYVYVVKEDIVEKKEVTIGKESNHSVVIEKGIEKDDFIVTKGKEFISEGEKVKIVQGDK